MSAYPSGSYQCSGSVLFCPLSLYEEKWNVGAQNKQGQVQRINQSFSYVSFETCAVFQVFTVQILFVEANTWDYIFKLIPAPLIQP